MTANKKFDKQSKFEVVSSTLLLLLNTVGQAKLTHSLISRKTGVSRAWLYKYIGSEKDDLIKFAIENFGKYITEQDVADNIKTRDDLIESIHRGISRMFQNTEQYPWFIPAYYKYRGGSASPSKVIAAIEQAYVRRQANHIKKLYSYSEQRALMSAEILTAFRLGLAFSWQCGDLKSKASKQEVLESVHLWLAEIFAS